MFLSVEKDAFHKEFHLVSKDSKSSRFCACLSLCQCHHCYSWAHVLCWSEHKIVPSEYDEAWSAEPLLCPASTEEEPWSDLTDICRHLSTKMRGGYLSLVLLNDFHRIHNLIIFPFYLKTFYIWICVSISVEYSQLYFLPF